MIKKINFYLFLLFLIAAVSSLKSQHSTELGVILNKVSYEKQALPLNHPSHTLKKQAHTSYNLGNSAYQEGYYKKAETYLLNGLELFTAAKDTFGMATSLLLLGKNYYRLYRTTYRSVEYFEKAENHNKACLALAEGLNHIPLIGETLLLSALLIERKDGYTKGEEAFAECLNFYEKHQLEKNELLFFVAENAFWRCRPKESISLCKKKLALEEFGEFEEAGSKTFNLIARCYKDMGRLDSAFLYHQKALISIKELTPSIQAYYIYNYYAQFLRSIGKRDKAKTYRQKAIIGFEHYLGSESISVLDNRIKLLRLVGDECDILSANEKIQDILHSYKNILPVDKLQYDWSYAHTLFNAKKFEESIIIYRELLQLAINKRIEWSEYELYYDLGENEYKLENYEMALEYGQKGIELGLSLGYTNGIEDFYNLLDRVHLKLGNYETAYKYQSLQNKVKDSLIVPVYQQDEILGYETKLAETLSEKEQIQIQKEEKEALAQRRQIGIYLLIVSLFIIVLSAYFYNRWSKKQAQIEIRKQITKDIHDNVGGVLNDLNRTVKEVLEKSTDNGPPPLKRVIHLSNQATATLRKVVSTNKDKDKPVSLEVIERILRDLTIKKMLYNQQPYELDIQGLHNKKLLSCKVHRNFLLIYKEALHNATKYGTKDPIYINISHEHNIISFTIINSICYQSKIEQELASTQMGLNNMRERTKLLKGEIEFEQTEDSFVVQFSCRHNV